MVELHPVLSRAQKLSQGLVRTSLSDSQLEETDEALRIPIVCWLT